MASQLDSFVYGRQWAYVASRFTSGSVRQTRRGEESIPEQITNNKEPYYAALEEADEKYQEGVVDVSAMEKLLSAMLAKQLVHLHKGATG